MESIFSADASIVAVADAASNPFSINILKTSIHDQIGISINENEVCCSRNGAKVITSRHLNRIQLKPFLMFRLN